MKNLTQLLSVGLIAIGLTACGNNQNTGTGYYDQNGNFVQGVNPNILGTNNCINGTNQNQLSLSFTGSAASFSPGSFMAGSLPASFPMPGNYGTMTMSGGVSNTAGSINLQKQTYSGTLNLSINPNARTVSGTVLISANALYNTGIMNYLYNYQQPTTTGQTGQVCVTSIGLYTIYSAQTGYYNTGSTGFINTALLYLTINGNTPIMTPIQF